VVFGRWKMGIRRWKLKAYKVCKEWEGEIWNMEVGRWKIANA